MLTREEAGFIVPSLETLLLLDFGATVCTVCMYVRMYVCSSFLFLAQTYNTCVLRRFLAAKTTDAHARTNFAAPLMRAALKSL